MTISDPPPSTLSRLGLRTMRVRAALTRRVAVGLLLIGLGDGPKALSNFVPWLGMLSVMPFGLTAGAAVHARAGGFRHGRSGVVAAPGVVAALLRLLLPITQLRGKQPSHHFGARRRTGRNWRVGGPGPGP